MKNPCKYTLPGHNAGSHLMVDLAVGMTLLADLRQLEDDAACIEARTHGKHAKVDAFYEDILAKMQ